jgi:putative PIN family toxin of toxin-antitoxin system
MRAVVDTNVWVSAVLNPAGPAATVRSTLQEKRFTLILSEPLLGELAEVLARPRFARRYGITQADISDLVGLLAERAEIIVVEGLVRLCRDPDDNVVIETALTGQADVLVTRDDDLKGESELVRTLHKRGVAVLTVRRFLNLLAGSPE